MKLIDKAFEDCVVLNQTTQPDGEGGYENIWQEGLRFKAAFDFNTSVEAKIAEKQGVTGLWNVYVEKNTNLEYHYILKRLTTGDIYRITSKDDKATPNGAGLNLRMVSAEEWKL